MLKTAVITPIYKKGSELDKTNYRPVSVLPCMSKLFEGVLLDQLSPFFEHCFSPILSGFRREHNCENVLMDFIDKCKLARDDNQVACAILSDLSRAFDCLPHQLLIAKFHAYGVNISACKLIANYFMDRCQCVKITNVHSNFQTVCKGAAQGSMFGPFTFNVLINDLVEMMSEKCGTYNYADGTSICCRGDNFEMACREAEQCIEYMLNWFDVNHLKANPAKFQFIVFEKEFHPRVITVGNSMLT